MRLGNNLHHYIMEDGEIKAVPLLEWAAWFECANRHVALTRVGPVLISTVFLGMDTGFEINYPLLLETMIFNQPDDFKLDGQMSRYHTMEEAQRGHKVFVELAREFYPDAEPEEEDCVIGVPPDRAAKYSALLASLSKG